MLNKLKESTSKLIAQTTQYFYKEDIQVANKYEKIHNTIL